MAKPELQLQRLEQLASGGRLGRLLHHPLRYLYAMVLLKLIYPVTGKGSLKKAPLYFGGTMQVLLPAATDIYLAGGKTHDSEIRLARFMTAYLKPGDTFLDVGAHFGYFTLMAAALVSKEGRVFSIEPSKGSFGLLAQNVQGHQNISIHHHAVSDSNEQVKFYEFPVLYSEYNALDVEKFRQESWMKKYHPETTTVQAVTIDGFVKQHGIAPAMIKIDVEGAEVKAIMGGQESWRALSPVLVMEYLDEGDESSYTAATTIMYGYGYKSYIIGAKGELVYVDNVPGYMRAHDMKSENVVFIKHNN